MNRRELLKGVASIPFLPLSSATTGRTLPVQPEPATTLLGRHYGVTAITRVWNGRDAEHCRLCPSCTAANGVCTVQTDRRVAEDEAPLYRLQG